MNKDIDKILDKGIEFLAGEQQADGSFLSCSSPHKASFKDAKVYHSIFSSTFILSSLNHLPETSRVKTIKDKLAKFLMTQKSKHWTFNYWVRGSKESKRLPYPDDLDDTSCALSALCEYKPSLIGGFALAKIVTVLTALEESEGGPYKTWLVPPDSEEVWRDVDLAVNANIGYFLYRQEVDLPKITALVESAIHNKKYFSPYYPSEYPIIYFISRWYCADMKKDIIDYLIKHRDGDSGWGNPLNTALATISLLNLGFSSKDVEQDILYIIESQKEGVWKPYAYCIDPAIERKKYYAGSVALTTAFCLEALNKFKVPAGGRSASGGKSQKSKPKAGQPLAEKVNNEKDGKKIYKEIIKKAKKRFSMLDTDLKRKANTFLTKFLTQGKSKEVLLLSYFFANSLNHNHKSKIFQPKADPPTAENPSTRGRSAFGGKSDLLVQLGLANLYGWMAYTIYDDFLDEEGDPKLLSVANVCLRELTEIFDEILPEDTGFADFSKKILDKIDSANNWEVSNCRFKISDLRSKKLKIPNYGDYSKLSEKSFGHALGPIAILFSFGYGENSPQIKSLINFFKHYIIARQLNDDAHDWEEDIKNGQINAVMAQILKEVASQKSKVPAYNDVSADRESMKMEELQQIFWYNVAPSVCEDILHHATLARESQADIAIIVDKSFADKLLVPIENSAKKALKERFEAIKFLKTYES